MIKKELIKLLLNDIFKINMKKKGMKIINEKRIK